MHDICSTRNEYVMSFANLTTDHVSLFFRALMRAVNRGAIQKFILSRVQPAVELKIVLISAQLMQTMVFLTTTLQGTRLPKL